MLGAGGEISEERTEADGDGAAQRSLLTLRVPDDAFDRVVGGLAAIAGTSPIDAETSTGDVRTEVIDVDVRVRLHRRSIERISELLRDTGFVAPESTGRPTPHVVGQDSDRQHEESPVDRGFLALPRGLPEPYTG